MRPRRVWALAARELSVLTRTGGVMVPLIALPGVFLAIFPAIVAYLPSTGQVPQALMTELVTVTDALPEAVKQSLAGRTREQQFVELMIVHFMAPIYLMVPLIFASAIAADSYAGERDRRTLEARLYLPVTDGELLASKFLAAWVPSLVISWLGFAVYTLVVNVAGWPVMQAWFFPTPPWLVLAGVVAPGAAAVGLTTGILVSSRVSTMQEASQLSSLVVVPLVALAALQVSGRVELSLERVSVMAAVLWATALVLLVFAARSCSRDALLSRR